MGTNYYWHGREACPTCGHRDDDLHIGKSSGGWCFSLHVYPEDESLPQNLDDWQRRFGLGGSEILDEYGCHIHADDMLATIRREGWKDLDPSHLTPAWLKQNHATPGPRGYARHLYSLVAHGDGMWDCVSGDFS